MRPFVVALALLVLPSLCAAQEAPKPIGRMAFDLRGFYSSLGQDPTTAQQLGLASTALPGRALGLEADIHYMLRHGRATALGVVGQAILASSHADQKDATGQSTGEPVEQRLRGVSAGISLDFGHRDGWSYVSAGFGPLAFPTYVGTTPPAESAPSDMTLNLGGGARWFSSKHFAFCFDMRFYQTVPAVQTEFYPGRARKNLLIISGGISVR